MERLARMSETSSQDEQALVNLASGIKPGTPSLDESPRPVHVGSTLGSFSLSVHSNPSRLTSVLSPPPPSALPLYQLLSVYRV